jgi:hypothetical protein
MATSAVGGTALERPQNYKEPTIKRVTKAQQTKIDAVTLKHENAVEQSTALGTLSDLVSNFTAAAAVLHRPYDSPFDKKIATLTPTVVAGYVGKPEQYISVNASTFAPKTAFNVEVTSIAKASKLTLPVGINYNPAVQGGGGAGFVGRLTFSVDGGPNVVVTPQNVLLAANK